MSSSARAEKYLVAEQVGKGSFGSANVVINKETKEKYVMKKIRLARLSDWQRRSSFQELQLVSSLDHPFVVPFVEGWVDRGHTINIVYGYCRNGDLGSLLHSRKGHFTEDRLKTWLAQTLLGLEYIHEAGVLHRDIKSSNLFLTEDYDIQIGDFGLATIRDGKSEADYSVVGTPHYMSPELLSKQKYDFASDIWSLGCVMYELTALKPAFNAFNMHGLISKIRKASVAPLPSQYSSDFCHLIRSMLKKSPSKRPTISDLINAPCMKEALAKAIKRGKNINKHFCYIQIRSETPSYWKSQFPSYDYGDSPDASEEPRTAPEEHKKCPEIRRTPSKSRKLRKQESGETMESNTERSHLSKPLKTTSSSPTVDAQVAIHEESTSSTMETKTPGEEVEDTTGQPHNQCDSESSSASPEDTHTCSPMLEAAEEDQYDDEEETVRDFVAPVSLVGVDDDEGNSHTNEQTEFECPGECSTPAEQSVPLPCKVEVVDVNKIDKDAVANENYFPHTHWSNPSHMSAFIDGRRGDGLEAIPEGSCEEGDSIMWNSLPTPAAAVFSICSPREQPVLELQRTLSGALDTRASSSLRGDSPFATDPRLSPCVSGSLNIDTQKRLDTLEHTLSLCANLYNKGRWHELGHILTQMPKQINLQGRDTPDSSTSNLTVCTGDRVVVGTSNPCNAIVRYYGPVAFGPGDWVGLELDTPVGKTDGTISGIPYFSCPKDCGLFVKASMFCKNEN